MMPALTSQETKQLLAFQTNEITEHHIYHQLSLLQKNENNRRILTELAAEESGHYQLLKTYTQKEVGPKKGKVRFYVWIARLFGLTFSIKLMENSEKYAQEAYRQTHLEDLQKIARDEEMLNYMSSVVLGLNDALVEFTGALAGYTFALQHAKLVALTGAITGIAAALSMAASEYLSTRTENNVHKNALKAAVYTGIAYVITVVVLILPFVLLSNVYWGLGVCLFGALVIIAIFNYYYSIVKTESFRHRFTEMAIISIGIAAISFLIGYALRVFTGIEL